MESEGDLLADMDRILEEVRRSNGEREMFGEGSKTQGCVPAGNHASG